MSRGAEESSEAGRLRGFLAFPMHAFAAEVESRMRALKPRFENVKWIDPAQSHITLHFFGQIPREEVSGIWELVTPVTKQFAPIVLALDQTGFFPNAAKPRVIWIGVRGETKNLICLQNELETLIKKKGYPVEDREFRPHLTVGRARKNQKIQVLSETHTPAAVGSEFQIPEIVFYESRLEPGGPRYVTLQKFELAGS